MASICRLAGIAAAHVLLGACLLKFFKQVSYSTRTPGSFS